MKCNQHGWTESEERVRFLTARRFNCRIQRWRIENIENYISNVRLFVAAGVSTHENDVDCRSAYVIHDVAYVRVRVRRRKLINTHGNYVKNVPETYLFQRS